MFDSVYAYAVTPGQYFSMAAGVPFGMGYLAYGVFLLFAMPWASRP